MPSGVTSFGLMTRPQPVTKRFSRLFLESKVRQKAKKNQKIFV